VDNTHQPNNYPKGKKMKTTLTKKIDNYLETTHGTITLLVAIGATIGALFALGMSSDYGITTATSFGIVFFLVFVGSVLGALGAYIVAEKIGYANSAQVSRSLHKHYGNELEKVRAEIESITNGYRALNTENADSARIIGELRDMNTELGKRIVTGTTELTRAYSTVSELQNVKRELIADLARYRQRLADYGCDLVEHDRADKYADTLHTLTNAVYHFGWALIEDGDLFESAKFRLLALHGETTTDTEKAQAFREYVLDIYADDDTPSVYLGEHFTPSA
jgi:hypothetical protein